MICTKWAVGQWGVWFEKGREKSEGESKEDS